MQMIVHGMHQLAQWQLGMGIYYFYNGAVQTIVHGMNQRVQMQL
jgi:hypothetical protein